MILDPHKRGEDSNDSLLTPDAGIDPARADYANVSAGDLNDSSHDFDNVDTPDVDILDVDAKDRLEARQTSAISMMGG